MLQLKLPDPRKCRLFAMLIALPWLMNGCGGGSLSKGLNNIQEQAMSAVSSYKSAKYYYESGDIILARRAALRTDPNRPDYADAQALLKEKIEPARLKLLRHYRDSAERAERQGKLYLAKDFYLKTAAVWIGDDKMQKEADRIDLILRQKRLDALAEQRRKEDAQLLEALDRYDPPKGLDPQDTPFARELERAQDRVLARGRNALNAAKRELREGHPEVAYVEAESYQRLRPGSRLGDRLMQDVREALPKSLRIPSEAKSSRRTVRSTSSSRNKPPANVTAEQIQQLMAEGKWLEAHDYAMMYRRDGGDDADTLLQSIDKTLKKQAEEAFRTGQMAFQQEKLDTAVEAWTQAALLQPENRDYTDSLRRATELQERFRILQGNTNADN